MDDVWKWAVSIIGAILSGITGYLVNKTDRLQADVNACKKDCADRFVARVEYVDAIHELRAKMDKMDGKLDTLISRQVRRDESHD